MPNTATSMVVASTIAETRAAIAKARSGGDRVAFVPTMGALHAGHLSLVERARAEADFCVMSIFVNPLQFAPTEDLSRYPRPIEEDERLAGDAGVDFLFRPSVDEMYPPGRTITVTAGELGIDWEGKSRPGHFDGVLTVVAKLFNIVQPDVTVFGRKDLQQAALIQALVHDLDMPVEVIVAPIVREPDGLALSSRNRYLSAEDRQRALVLSRSLAAARDRFQQGERSVAALEDAANRVMHSESEVKADYLAVIDPATFRRPDSARAEHAVIVAARVGTTRLIDNMLLGRE